MFQGFSAQAQDFLWGIALNNNREWFMAHKGEYTQGVYAPLKELAFSVQARMQELYPGEAWNCKVTRIYRDARITHPDGPYKTNLWFMLEQPTDPQEKQVRPAFFFEIEGSGYSTGVDFYCTQPAVMEQYRKKLLAQSARAKELTLLLQQRPEYGIVGPEYKRSRGQVEPLLLPWFNRKRLCILAGRDWGQELHRAELVEQIVREFQWLRPFYDFLKL